MVLYQRTKKGRKNALDSERHLFAINNLEKNKSQILVDKKTDKPYVMVDGKQIFLKEDV